MQTFFNCQKLKEGMKKYERNKKGAVAIITDLELTYNFYCDRLRLLSKNQLICTCERGCMGNIRARGIFNKLLKIQIQQMKG